MQYKNQMGGWWGLATDKKRPRDDGSDSSSPSHQSKSGRKQWWSGESTEDSPGATGSSDVEDKINALATALGMPPKELASAIVNAAKVYVPPASLSSLSSAAARESG